MAANKFDITLIQDYALTESDRDALLQLLALCFPGFFTDRLYFKQAPKARFLVRDHEQIVAQMGMEHRVVKMGNIPVQIFGVIDLCVAPHFRGRGIGSELLRRLEELGRQHELDFVILFADDHRLYRQHGYENVANTCRWLAIEAHESVTILEKPLGDSFMVKTIGHHAWDESVVVDLLGYLF